MRKVGGITLAIALVLLCGVVYALGTTVKVYVDPERTIIVPWACSVVAL